jgi:proton glutamate symport protein
MLKLQLHWQIFIALVLAVLFGLFLPDFAEYVTWMGEIFLRALKMIVVPLIITSVITGVSNIGSAKNLGRLGAKTISYYLTTSLLAILVGFGLVNLISPGVGADMGLKEDVKNLGVASDSLGNILLRMVPDNIFTALASADMLAIIFFSILFGFFITRIDDHYKTKLIDLFNGGFQVMMKITMFVIRFAPLGIFGIVVKVVSEQEDLASLMGSMGLYMSTVVIGLIFHGMITLPLLLKFIGRINPWLHFKAMTTPLITAFSTSSSSATLPLTMEAVENRSGVSNKITSFVLPLGATVNMDGTALYECVAVMFIAQVYGMELTLALQGTLIISALLVSIGAAGIPMAGLVMMTVILSALGLPLEGVGLILAVDRILDMSRTVINVWSDSCGAAIIAKTEGETLKV